MPVIDRDQVLVRIRAAGVNPFDWARRAGDLEPELPARFPLTLGMDCAGEVVEMAAEAWRFAPGDHVFGFANGAYAEFAAIRQSRIARMPPRLDFATAASLPTPGLTASQAMLQVIGVHEGQRVLVLGAAGAVGSFAVQLALWKKALVTAVANGRDVLYLERLGVVDVIDYEDEAFEDEVEEVDAVLDLVGGETLERAYRVLRPGGTLVTTLGELDEEELARQSLRGVAFELKPDVDGLEELARLVGNGVVVPKPTQRLPLERAREAHDLYAPGRSHPKIVLEM
jgi:NADPH:quinone reductase-like Zn-dependent oxidoreductase